MNLGYVLIGIAVLAFLFAMAALTGAAVWRISRPEGTVRLPGKSASKVVASSPVAAPGPAVWPTLEALIDELENQSVRQSQFDDMQAKLAGLVVDPLPKV